MNSTRNVSQEELNIACSFVSGQEGEHAKQLHATFCVAGEGKPLKQIPAQHTVFCMLKDAEARFRNGLEITEEAFDKFEALTGRRYDRVMTYRTDDADVLVSDAGATTVFEAARAADPDLPPKRLANWVTGEYLRLAKGEDDEVAVVRMRFGIPGLLQA